MIMAAGLKDRSHPRSFDFSSLGVALFFVDGHGWLAFFVIATTQADDVLRYTGAISNATRSSKRRYALAQRFTFPHTRISNGS